LALVLVASGCATQRVTHERLHGILWSQTSIEYQAAAIQSFSVARKSVEKALKDSSWTAALEQSKGYERLKPAVILDVDETVLDSSPLQARLVRAGIDYNHTLWEAWVNESNADSIPGAKEFIQFLKEKGVKVFYVTNRILEQPTVENIRNVLDPSVSADDVLCKKEKPDWGSDKTSRRELIAQQYRILLLVGDDYNDFTFLDKVSPETRIEKTKQHKHYWGEKWILISNPLYGNWERALYNYDLKMPDNEKLKEKYRYLRTKNI
jgi:acid phosphatase